MPRRQDGDSVHDYDPDSGLLHSQVAGDQAETTEQREALVKSWEEAAATMPWLNSGLVKGEPRPAGPQLFELVAAALMPAFTGLPACSVVLTQRTGNVIETVIADEEGHEVIVKILPFDVP